MKPILTLNGQKFYPVTKIENVVSDSGQTLDEVLAQTSLKDEQGNSYAISVERGSIVLKKITPTQVVESFVVPDSLVLNSGASYQIIPVADERNGSYKFATNNESVAKVGDEGVVVGVSAGEATITVTSGNAIREMGVIIGAQVSDSSEIEAMVTRAYDDIVIVNPFDTLSVGYERSLQAVGINSTGLRYDIWDQNFVKFESSNPEIASVEFGVVTANKEGSCEIIASSIDGSVTKSMPLTVTPAEVDDLAEGQIYRVDDHKFNIYNNGTHSQETTAGIAEAIKYASEQGYRKVLFNKGEYLVNADHLPNATAIEIPSGLIVDFNDAIIRIEYGNKTANGGYELFVFNNAVDSQLINATILGENYNSESLIRRENNYSLQVKGNSKHIRVKNCRFAWAVGFNVGIAYSRSPVTGIRLSNIEAGGIGSNGANITAADTFRSIDYNSAASLTDSWCLGNLMGYQTIYLRSRLYDIFFYDEGYNLIYTKANCWQNQKYYFPDGINPSWLKIQFFQEDAPTGGDTSWGETIPIYVNDLQNPEDVVFEGCTFDHAISTGLSPQGGDGVLIKNCTFEDNGYQDPFSHIDWEDARQIASGHIVSGCRFHYTGSFGTSSCQLINIQSRSLAIHDSYIQGGNIQNRDSATEARYFHNTILGVRKNTNVATGIYSKNDMVWANNFDDNPPTFVAPEGDCRIVVVDNKQI